MKAKVKKTGEIIELNDTSSLIDFLRGILRDKDGKKYMEGEIEIIAEKEKKTIDWEQRRYEIAQKILCNSINCLSQSFCDLDVIASKAVRAANSLVKELKSINSNEEKFNGD